VTWDEDQPLPEDKDIKAAHPVRSGRHEEYQEAMRMVGAKRSKGALVELVSWLLIRVKDVSVDLARHVNRDRNATSACSAEPSCWCDTCELRRVRERLQWMVDRAAAGQNGTPSLDGYRELGAKAARAENEATLLRVELLVETQNDQPWPVAQIVERLADAADHLMRDHDCDAHGYESVCAARDAGRAWLAARAARGAS
jgi:hypothetical protein